MLSQIKSSPLYLELFTDKISLPVGHMHLLLGEPSSLSGYTPNKSESLDLMKTKKYTQSVALKSVCQTSQILSYTLRSADSSTEVRSAKRCLRKTQHYEFTLNDKTSPKIYSS